MLYVWNEHWYLTILKYHYFISASTCVCIQNGQKAVKGGYAIENVSLYIYGFSRNEKIHLNSILKYSIVPPNMIIRWAFRFSWWWGIVPCSLVEIDLYFRGGYCLHPFRCDHGGSKYLWNVRQHPRSHTSSWILFLITKIWISLVWHRAVFLLFLWKLCIQQFV